MQHVSNHIEELIFWLSLYLLASHYDYLRFYGSWFTFLVVLLCLFLFPFSLSPSPSGAEVLAEYEYDALHDDELTLRPGDIIKNVRYIEEEGWMEGELNGRRGVFPDNFVKVGDHRWVLYWFLEFYQRSSRCGLLTG